MSLHFRKLRYRNFLSVGNDFVEFDFTQHRTTLIVGANGSGKSSFIDALVFGLYGKPYRKINKPQLVNSINTNHLLVEIEFRSNKSEYLIRRGLKPAIFEIYQDGNMLAQDSNARDYQEAFEANILKIGFKSFTQIIVLGSATHVPFMQLPAQSRREVVEDLLDIQVFSIMNSLLKDRLQEFKETVTANQTALTIIQSKLEMAHKHIEAMRTSNQELIEEKQEEIRLLQDDIELKNSHIDEQITVQERIEASLPKLDYKTKINELFLICNQLEEKKERIDNEIAFYHKNDSCPTCKQTIDVHFQQTAINSKTAISTNLSEKIDIARWKYDEMTETLKDIQFRQDEIAKITNNLQAMRSEIRRDEQLITKLKSEIEKLKERNETEHIDTQEMLNDESKLLEEKFELKDRGEVYAAAATLLKDGGIKGKIVRQYVPIMNKLISKYLAAMDFYVQFELDENFNEKILSRYRDEFSYESFSEGEKFRIDISLLFTWRAIAKLRNRSNCNLLILDEIFDGSLDTAGTEEFLKIIYQLAEDTNVYMISHSSQVMQDRFDKVIKFSKTKNFSQMGAG